MPDIEVVVVGEVGALAAAALGDLQATRRQVIQSPASAVTDVVEHLVARGVDVLGVRSVRPTGDEAPTAETAADVQGREA